VEKLFEELYRHAENLDRTAHEKIFVLRNGHSTTAQASRVRELVAAAEEGDGLRLRHLLAEVVPDYAPAGRSKAEPPVLRGPRT